MPPKVAPEIAAAPAGQAGGVQDAKAKPKARVKASAATVQVRPGMTLGCGKLQ